MKNKANTKSKKKQRSILRRILLIIIGLILGVNVYLANAKGIVGNKLPMPFGYGMANVLISMQLWDEIRPLFFWSYFVL
nr:hypothetical protein [uncultured Anaerostipes sp.]